MLAYKLRSSKAFVTFVVCVAMFTDMGLVNLILPVLPYALSDRVGLAPEDVQRWNSILLASFGAAQMLGSLFFGWIGDKSPSRQTPFILGLVTLGTSTLCFAVGSTLPVLLIARLLQGLSSAIVFTIGNALILDVVGNEGIGKASGYAGMAITLGILSGPVVGGFIYDQAGYSAVFFPAYALIIVDIALRFLIVVDEHVSTSGEFSEGVTDTTPCKDYTQASKDASNSSVIQHDESQRTEVDVLLPKARPRSRSFPVLILLSAPRFLLAFACLFMVNSFMTGFDGVLAVYVHDTLNFDASKSACLFLILALPALLSPISGWLTDYFGTKWPAAAGLLLLTPSLVVLRLIHHGVASPFLKLGFMLAAIGASVTLINPAFMKEALSAVKEIEEKSSGVFGPYGANALAYGLLNCAFAGGSVVGPIYAGFIRSQFGWPVMSLVMGISSFILLIFTVLITGGFGLRRNRAPAPCDGLEREENA